MKLTFTLTMDAESQGLIPDITISVSEKVGGTLVSENYITLPDQTTLTKTDFRAGPDFTKEVTLTWGWGSIFGNVEPTTYFNEDETGASKPYSTVVETMNNFKTATVNHPGFTISFAKAVAGE